MQDDAMQDEKIDPRMQLANDVLAQLDARRLTARHYVYLRADVPEWRRNPWDPRQLEAPSLDVRELLREKTCEVCALGALFVARVDRVNGIRTAELTMNDCVGMRMYLSEVFPPQQQLMIELAFEGPNFYNESEEDAAEHEIPWDPELASDAAHFGESRGVWTAGELMREIMRNIIQHGGDFIPPKWVGIEER